jgi:hypothetical protein
MNEQSDYIIIKSYPLASVDHEGIIGHNREETEDGVRREGENKGE